MTTRMMGPKTKKTPKMTASTATPLQRIPPNRNRRGEEVEEEAGASPRFSISVSPKPRNGDDLQVVSGP